MRISNGAGFSASPTRHTHPLQGVSAVNRSRARLWRAPAGSRRTPGTSRPLGSSRQPSYSSSATARTSCDQPRQHAIHHQSHSCTRTSKIRPTYGRTPYAAHWSHHRAACTKSLPAPTKHLKLSCAAGRSLYQQTESSLHTYLTGPRTTLRLTPAAHRPNHSSHTTNPGSADYTIQSRCTLPGSLHYPSPLLRSKVTWGHPHGQWSLFLKAALLHYSALYTACSLH